VIPVRINDHVERGLARLIEQYKRSTKFKLLIATYLRRLQRIEDFYWELLTERGIDSAVGAQLDIIGKIVKRPRGGLADSDYRIALYAEILILRSDGRMNDLIDVALLSIPPDYSFSTVDEGTATIRFSILDHVEFDALVLFRVLKRAKLGGVRLLYEFFSQPLDYYFVWKSDDSETDTGFCHYGDTNGGLLECVLAG
jgi:hypothetical protein